MPDAPGKKLGNDKSVRHCDESANADEEAI